MFPIAKEESLSTITEVKTCPFFIRYFHRSSIFVLFSHHKHHIQLQPSLVFAPVGGNDVAAFMKIVQIYRNEGFDDNSFLDDGCYYCPYGRVEVSKLSFHRA